MRKTLQDKIINRIYLYDNMIYLLFLALAGSFIMVSCKKEKKDEIEALQNWPLHSRLFRGSSVLLEWSAAPKGCIGAEIKYTDSKGDPQTVIVPSYKTVFELLNYNASGAPFQYRSIYLQSPQAVDTSYSDYQTVSDILRGAYSLPEETSRYNRGGDQFAGRYKDEKGQIKLFELTDNHAQLYDGSGRALGTVTQPVKVNMGTEKEMEIQGSTETCIWAWDTNIGLSGWMPRSSLADPPALLGPGDPFASTNPAPPQESKEALKINTVSGRAKLAGLRHKNSTGLIPATGNHGEDYAGRNPGPLDYVYLCRAVPNVQKGGTSKDSMPDGSFFIPALDEYGRLMTEVMTMYQNGDLNKPVDVTFIYGRSMDSNIYGWIARANIGDL